MTNYICITCGVQHAETEAPPEHCPICEDERQYIGHNGQRWTSLAELQKDHHNRIEQVDTEPDRHRHGAGLRHRTTGAVGPHAER